MSKYSRKTLDEYIEHVQQVLTLLNDVGVTLNFEKCKFFTNVIDYLGLAFAQGPSRC